MCPSRGWVCKMRYGVLIPIIFVALYQALFDKGHKIIFHFLREMMMQKEESVL